MVFPLWFGLHDFLGGSLLNVIERFIQNVDTFKAVEIAARLWVIWSARNDRLWNDKVWSLEDLRRAVESFLHDWKLAYSPSENMSQVHSVASPAVWHPPPEGSVKCNIDASLRESSMGYGAVIRNHQGQFVAALNGRLFCDRDPAMNDKMKIFMFSSFLVFQALCSVSSAATSGSIYDNFVDCVTGADSPISKDQNATDVVLEYQKAVTTMDSNLFLRLLLEPITPPSIVDPVTGKKIKQNKTIRVTAIGQFLGDKSWLLSVTDKELPVLGIKSSDLIEMTWIQSILQWANFDYNTTKPEILLSRVPNEFYNTPLMNAASIFVCQGFSFSNLPIYSKQTRICRSGCGFEEP
nr:berberine bridge enzyme-like 21 [Ipomoea trifida]